MRQLSIILATLLIAGVAFAGVTGTPDADNVTYLDGHKGPLEDPQVEVRLVRYALLADDTPPLNSGDACVWDTVSGDGITISGAVTQNTGRDTYVAGVLVTEINTADSSTFDFTNDNWGYMAVRGFCLARCDSTTVAGHPLIIADAVLIDTGFVTLPQVNISQDIGVCLTAPASDGLARVMLK